MADHAPLTPERLSELLSRLDEVMADAAKLRRQLTNQLDEQSGEEQPKASAARGRRVKRR